VSREIFDLLLFVSYFAAQSKGIKFGDYFFHVSRLNSKFWLDARYPQQATVAYRNSYNQRKKIGIIFRSQLFFFFQGKL